MSADSSSAARSRWVLFVALAAAGLFLYPLRTVFIPFVIAAGLTYILGPVVNLAEHHTRLHRVPVVFLLYLVILTPLATFGYLYGPAAMVQLKNFFRELPDLLPRVVAELMGGQQIRIMSRTVTAQEVAGQMLAMARDRLATPGGVVGLGQQLIRGLLGGILTLVVLFYFLASRDLFARVLRELTPRQHHWRVNKLVEGVHFLLGRYLRGILLVILYAGGTAYLGLHFLFDLPYALPLAVLSGLLEVLPVVGPILSITLACLLAMVTGGFWLLLRVGGFYGVLRLTIDNLLAPLILGWAAVIHPAMVLFAFLAGGTLFGILGLLLAVPTAAVVRLLLANWDDYFG